MKRILTYGTFDLLHYGHLYLLKRAKLLGGELYVGVSTDEFNAEKNKRAQFPYEERIALLDELKSVDFVFPEASWEQKQSDIQKYNIDTFVIGSDWAGKFDHLKEFCHVEYLPRTDRISSTLLRSLHKESEQI